MIDYVEILKNFIIDFLKDEKVKVFLFGSRARKDYDETSDIDIGFIPYDNFKESKLILLKEKIEELNIPYRVEIVDFRHVSDKFKKETLKDIVIWKD